jgi:predicted DNA-binding ribbon-helix-helix protein
MARAGAAAGTAAVVVMVSQIARAKLTKTNVFKRSIAFGGHKTSISLEDEFWDALKEIASDRYVMPSDLVADINANRQHANLSSAIRVFVLGFYRDQIPLLSLSHTTGCGDNSLAAGRQ